MTDVKKPLADELAETLLDTAQEWARRWQLDNGQEVKAIWGPQGLLTLENQDTGHSADFQVRVTATQLPAHAGADGSCPDYGSTTDPCPPGCASGKCVALRRPEPGSDGKSPSNLILAVLAAARALVSTPGYGFQTLYGGPEADLARAVAELGVALEAEARELGQPESGHWHPTTWGDTATVKGGARVRVGGQHEAIVETVVAAHWVGSGATTLRVKLEGREQPYTMPPSGPVEVWTPALPEWAGQAYLALAQSFGEVSPRG